MDVFGHIRDLSKQVVFQIPLNQRGYAWEKANWEALISDINGLDDGVNHYCGPIVITTTQEKKSINRVYNQDLPVVNIEDGQQRVTTLILAALAIVQECERRKEELEPLADMKNTLIKEVLYWSEDGMARSEDYNNRRLVAENREVDRFLEDLFTGRSSRSDKNASMSRLEKMLKLQKKYLNTLTAEGIYKVYQNLFARIQFVFVDLKKHKINPHVAFHTINSRGVPLRAFDIVKNSLMYEASKFGGAEQVESSWFKAVSDLDDAGLSSREDEFLKLSFSMNFEEGSVSPPVGEKIIDHVIKKQGAADRQRITSFCQAWEELIRSYCFVTKSDKWEFYKGGKNESATNRYVDSLRRIDSMKLSGISRPLFVAIECRIEDEETKARLGVLIEKFVFRVWCVGKRRVTFLGRHILDLSSALYHGKKTARDVELTIVKWISKYGPLDDLLIDMFDTNRLNYDNWETNRLHYFLLEYEHHLGSQSEHPVAWKKESDQVEHICPQILTKESDEKRFERLTAEWQEAFETAYTWQRNRHRLGNLSLTRQNQELQAKAWNDKKGLYNKDSSTLSEKQLESFTNNKGWTPTSIKLRELAMARFFVKRWNIGLDSEQQLKTPEVFSDMLGNTNLGESVVSIYDAHTISEVATSDNEETIIESDKVSLEESED